MPNFNLLSAPNVFCVAFLYEIQFDEAFRELVETKETSVLGWGVPFQCGERDIPCVGRGQGYLFLAWRCHFSGTNCTYQNLAEIHLKYTHIMFLVE